MSNFHEIIDQVNKGKDEWEYIVVSVNTGGTRLSFRCALEWFDYTDEDYIRIGDEDQWIDVDPHRVNSYFDVACDELTLIDRHDATEIVLSFI